MTTALEGGEGSASRPGRFITGKDPVPIVREAGWAPGPVWTGAENLAFNSIQFPDRPARSQSLYRLRYPAHYCAVVGNKTVYIREIHGIWITLHFIYGVGSINYPRDVQGIVWNQLRRVRRFRHRPSFFSSTWRSENNRNLIWKSSEINKYRLNDKLLIVKAVVQSRTFICLICKIIRIKQNEMSNLWNAYEVPLFTRQIHSAKL